MANPSSNQLQEQLIKLTSQVAHLTIANSNLTDEVQALKQNYGQLVDDVNSRLEAVHKKVFR